MPTLQPVKKGIEAVETYIASVAAKFDTGQAREHAYRTPFEELIRVVCPFLTQIINDPKHSEHGAPDSVFLKGSLIAGYAETKDIGENLDKVEKSAQMERYFGYSNIILTNYVEFRFYRNGQKWCEPITIATLSGKTLSFRPELFPEIESTLRDFLSSQPEAVKSGEVLAKIMGGKARRIRDGVRRFLNEDNGKSGELILVRDALRHFLVPDLTNEHFADLYAQTLVYGLFVARYYDKTPETFSRQEARDLVPASNPFLGHFFDHIAGRNFDVRLGRIVDELCSVFRVADVEALMEQYFKNDLFGNTHADPDPVIHFYEDFLKEYDPDMRKRMGAYYTPLPVVRFIVNAVDHLLEKEFGLVDGLADTTEVTKGIHKVQILDPAVGTGTFLSATIRAIYTRLKAAKQKGKWHMYVHHSLLPRLHGFEIMMAPYTIAHLKLSIEFKKTGFFTFYRRLGIYLTNALEKGVNQELQLGGVGFTESLAVESREAAKVKNDLPIMVVIGNPPYSVSSQNKGEWIQTLIKDYKEGLGERKINLDDDYIKFLRFSEHFIEKNKTGIVAMITNNSFIDGITHRQMRKHLLQTFDDIYILDLHGNLKKKEKAPDGGKDENVFDIQQGVAISIFIRRNVEKAGLGLVHHAELYGKRGVKFETLSKNSFPTIKWRNLNYSDPYYFFVPKDFAKKDEYEKGFEIQELFINYNSGIQTKNDDLTVNFTEDGISDVVNDFLQCELSQIKQKYNADDTGIWKVSVAQADLQRGDYRISSLTYRPFDFRYTAITPRSSGFLARPRMKTTQHLLCENIGLLFSRSIPEQRDFSEIFVSDKPIDLHAAAGQTYCAPLYTYDNDGIKKKPNLNGGIFAKFLEVEPKTEAIDVFDYIYAVLHSPKYRQKYKEFLKIDFPRVPYPKDAKQFKALVVLGRELRGLHLLESPKVKKPITSYNISGSDTVEKITYNDGKVSINKAQYFGGVPEIAWNFWIGGYQPAQKWLKDRKGRTLTNSDIEHYQKIIVALAETDRIMKEVDTIAL